MPHWFQSLAKEAGYNYAVGGQYGFLPQHANLPPVAQWGFDSVASAWDSDNYSFSQPNFDNVLITPGNFIQWQGPSVDYFGDTQSPLDYTSQIFDWTNAQEDSITLFIYENWPDMGAHLSQGFPPSQSEWTSYNIDLQGSFHDWFLEYHDSLIIAHPNNCVRMIPTGPVIGNLLMQSPFDQIPIDTLYEDDAPHGRPTIYFLAGLITYMAMYEEAAPSTYQVPSIIDPIIASNYQQVVDFIWSELQNFNTVMGDSRVFCEEDYSSLGIIDDPELHVYPNPTKKTLSVASDHPIYSIELVDMKGKVILQQRTSNLDLSSISSGVYQLKVIFTNGQAMMERVIKE
jgi:hypothetical protein